MAKIPLPERGQPLDVAYVYDLAQAVNELSKEVSPAMYDYVTIQTSDAGPQNRKVTEIRVIGALSKVSSTGQSVSAGQQLPFGANFQGEFRFPPIVTATAINVGQTPAGGDVTVILNDPTPSGVTGFVKFNTSGVVSVNVNMIIMGIPN
jgi:hypothetical protein